MDNEKAFQLILSKIDDLKDFYISTKEDLDADVIELKASHDKLTATLETYTINHYGYHKKEKKKFWRIILVVGAISAFLGASGLAEVAFPYIKTFISLFF